MCMLYLIAKLDTLKRPDDMSKVYLGQSPESRLQEKNLKTERATDINQFACYTQKGVSVQMKHVLLKASYSISVKTRVGASVRMAPNRPHATSALHLVQLKLQSDLYHHVKRLSKSYKVHLKMQNYYFF